MNANPSNDTANVSSANAKEPQSLSLHIAPTPFFADRGCHIRIEGIVRCLSALNWRSIVCTYHHGHEVAGVETRRIAPIKAYTQTSAGPNLWKLWADLKLLFLTLGVYRRQRPAVLHAHLHEGLFIALIVKTLFFWRRTPLIADLQGSFTGELDSYGAFKKLKWLKPLSRWAERCLMWFPNHIVCSSTRSLALFTHEFGIAAERISLAQDGADAGPELSQAQRTRLKQSLGLPNDRVIVIYSGALLASKGLTELQQLIQASPASAVHFLLIGYPTEALNEFLQENALASVCTVLGQVPFAELPQWLHLSDIAIDPKNFDAGEGSGKMLNYMANGLPVLAFNTENNRRFLPSGSPLANDVDQLVDQLVAWVNDPQLRANAAQRNKAFFNEHYSWAVTTEQLRTVYGKV